MGFRVFWCLGCMLVVWGMSGENLVLSVEQILRRIWENNVWLKSLNFEAQRPHYDALALNNHTLPSVGVGTITCPWFDPQGFKGTYVQMYFRYSIPLQTKLKEQRNYLHALGAVKDSDKEIYFNQLRVEVKKICFEWIMALRQVDTLRHYLGYLQLMKKTEQQNLDHIEGAMGGQTTGPSNAEQALENSLNAIAMAEVKATELQSLITSLLGHTDSYRYTLNSLMGQEADFQFGLDTSVNVALISAENFDSLNLIYYRKDLQKTDKMLHALQLKLQTLSSNPQPPRLTFSLQPLFAVKTHSKHLFNFLAQANIPIFGQHSPSKTAAIQSIRLQMQALEQSRNHEYKKIQSKLYALETRIDLARHKIQLWEQKVLPKLRQIFRSHLSMYELNQVSLNTLLADWEKLKNASLQILAETLNVWTSSAEYEGELYR